jgi:hypothetical protein
MRIFFLSLLITVFMASAQLIWADATYRLILDKNLSSYTGAHNIITLHRGIYELEKSLLKTKWFEENSFVNKSAGIVYRLTKSVFIENVIDHMGFLAQHEVFGHGARYREFGFKNNEYTLHLVFPYGDSQGRASPGELDPQRFTTIHEHLAMITGGSNSNIILSSLLKYKWLERGSINFRETILYLISSNDLSSYIWRTKWGLRSSRSNDVLNYLRVINAHNGLYQEEDYRMTLDRLSQHALINVLDPFQYFSLFTYFVTYLWSGNESFQLPMISLWGFQYLPSFHLGLTPFGPEFYFEHFFLYKEKILNFFLRYGEPTFHQFWGLGVEAIDLISYKDISINPRFNLWNQPALLLGGEKITHGNSGLGFSVFITALLRISNTRPAIRLVGEIGYKTSGFVPGEMLSEGFSFRAGLGFLIPGKK